MSALRSLRQISVSTSRALAARSVPAARFCLPALASRVSMTATRTFSVSARSLAEGSSDVVLSQKLAEELQYEKAATVDATEPDFLKAFKEQGVWKINDVAGEDGVVLSRKFGNENIRVVFSVADMQAREHEAYENEEENEDSESDDVPIHTYGVHVALTVTKSNGTGAIAFETICQEGSFMVDSVSFFKDAKVATEANPEVEWKKRVLYLGPQFDTLDVSVQEEFEKYLQERGINESLAIFIPEYAEYKEQQEYIKWLKAVKTFVEL